MTKEQALALYFPIFVTGILGSLAYFGVRWINNAYPARRKVDLPTADEAFKMMTAQRLGIPEENITIADKALGQADDLIQQARRQLRSAS